MTTIRDRRERRSATVALGLLAAALLVAGGLPWATGGTLAVRLIAVPLLLLGVLAGVAAALLPARGPLRRPAPAGAGRPPHHCDHCAAAPVSTDPAGPAGGSPQPS